MVSQETGEWMVKFSRQVIENIVKNQKTKIPKNYPDELNEKKGVFVTIRTYPKKELRGCIGLPYPTQTLIRGLIETSREVCFDPRFPPLKEEELNKIIIEVSILGEPKLIEVEKPSEYFEKIKIGKDGLIISNPPFSGLLLPEVPLEFGWGIIEYLQNLCRKAGLPPNAWEFETTKIYKFQAEVFEEIEPNGRVIRKITSH